MVTDQEGTAPQTLEPRTQGDHSDQETNSSGTPDPAVDGRASTTKTTKTQATETPEASAAETPGLTAQELQEYKELKAAKTKAEREALSKEQQNELELKEARQQAREAQRRALLAEHRVPSELRDLIPADPEAAETYLKSDGYTKVRTALEASKALATTATKDQAQEKPKTQSKGDRALNVGTVFSSFLGYGT